MAFYRLMLMDSEKFTFHTRFDPSKPPIIPRSGSRRAISLAIPLLFVLAIGISLGYISDTGSKTSFGRVLSETGSDDSVILKEAYRAITLKDFNKAASLALDVKSKNPANPLACHILGLANARRGFLEEAANEFSLATELKPDFHEAWYDLGVVDETRGEFTQALTAYQNALELNKSDIKYQTAYDRVRKILTGDSDWKQRITESERLFHSAVDALNRGGINDLNYAETTFRALIKDRPYDVACRNLLAMTLAKKGYSDEAEQILIGVVNDEPGFSDAWYNLAVLHLSMGDSERALSELKTAHASSSLESFKSKIEQEIREIESQENNSGSNPN